MVAIDNPGADRSVSGVSKDHRRSDTPPEASQAPADLSGRWLSINAACEILGVDQSTLRRWSDSGRVPVFRTPGGHRRYSEDDLRALLAGNRVEPRPISRRELEALTRVEFVRRMGSSVFENFTDVQPTRNWAAELDRTVDNMIDTSIRYASGRGDPDQLLEDGRGLAIDYGCCTAAAGLKISQAVKSFIRFRRTMLDALGRYVESQNFSVRQSCRMIGKLNAYLDVMLTAVVEAHEANSQE